MRECCGVFGIFSFNGNNITPMLLTGLETLQHRGQESWGIAVENVRPYRKKGLVSSSYEKNYHEINKIKGDIGIGHVRYSTTASSSLKNAHPLEIGGIDGFCIAHNGTIDREPLFNLLKKTGHTPPRGITDTELIGLGLYHHLKLKKDWLHAFKSLNSQLNGSFSILVLTANGELIGARDERGFRPLCLGWHEETQSYIISSESCALNILNAKLLRDIQPGEMIKIDANGLKKQRFAVKEKHAHCPFEYVYFASPSSDLEGINVYDVRKRIGKLLAEKYSIQADIVVPVPDSARPSALGYSEKSGIPFEEGLMKNRYMKKGSWRSFIEPEKRSAVVYRITAVKSVIEGKEIVLVDDSIVRGTSSKMIIKNKLKTAKKISLLITFPPIMYPCYAGIDFPTQEELLAYRVCKKSLNLEDINKRVGEEIEVNFLGYNDTKRLSKGIGLPLDQLCLSCITGDYSCLKYTPKFKKREEMKA
jgi:amidophosphoribosyltransferase